MPPRPSGRSHAVLGAFVACLTVPASARGACPAEPEGLEVALGAVTSAFEAMDIEGFYSRRDEARATLGCLTAAIPPSLAAAYHQMEALDAFLGRDVPGTVASFRAARSADPSAALPSDLAFEGNPLYDAWRAAESTPASAVESARVADGALLVDGRPADAVPTEHPAVVQEVGGAVRTAWIADPSDAPPWLSVGAPMPEPEPVVAPLPAPPPAPEPRRWPTTPLLVASGATAAVAAGLLGGGLYHRGRFEDPDTAFEDLAGHRSRANGLGVAAQVSAGVAVGLGGVALIGGAF